LVGLATDDLMIVQEFWVVFLLGSQKDNHFITSIKHIVATTPFTMNDNELVIGDKFITGLNAVCRVTVSIILEEREFVVGHTWWWVGCYIVYIIGYIPSNQ